MPAKFKVRDGYVRICSIAKEGIIASFNSEGRNAIVFFNFEGQNARDVSNSKAAWARFVTMSMHNARHV